ncbi:AroM family protein [Sphingomonas crocodyli]|uniref:AroM family protein n=1 Tax=Sphingomonas crocodyli TaxID=1979270 RepID=A0A437M728_9SPHN|nr:AroM family protein [Sphingomonas crocodyli]RVT93472.1 AroM family protein [Sphingomonas crocodyli]
MSVRVAFVTIGQSPRSDMLPEILAHCSVAFEAIERGALDGLDDAQIAALAPKAHQGHLLTRLRDGRDVIVGKPAIEQRLQTIIKDLDTQGFDLLVLLCTGHFDRFGTSTPLLHAQHVVDHLVQGLASDAERVGIILPSPDQVSEFHGLGNLPVKVVSASPYAPDHDAALREAGTALADTDIIVLHCMGFTEAMRRVVSDAANRPALAPRRLLAHAIDIMLS